jgi:hypothetical protein
MMLGFRVECMGEVRWFEDLHVTRSAATRVNGEESGPLRQPRYPLNRR